MDLLDDISNWFQDRLSGWGAVLELNWGLELLTIVTLTLLLRYGVTRLLRGARRQAAKSANPWDDVLLESLSAPLGWFILAMGLIWAVEISAGYVDSELFSGANLGVIRQLAFIFLGALFLVRFIALAETSYLAKAGADSTTVHALAKLLRLSVVITAGLIALPTLGIEVTALLAFGGVGGIAVGFAAQDLLANFFGGLMIYLDRPFAVGDWIRSPDRQIEGTVESIGWRLTVVRTFDKRPLYVPNSVFTKLAIENPSRMSNRRIYETIGIRYEDAAKMGDIVADIKAMLNGHDAIDSSQTLIVNFNGYGESSLDFFVYAFTRTTDWVEFHGVKQDVLLKITAIVHGHGADFAFPSRTVYMQGHDGGPVHLSGNISGKEAKRK